MSKVSLLLILFLTITHGAFALEEDCDDAKPSLTDKVAVPSFEFKHKGYITPEEMNKFSSREIAELLVKRMSRECDTVRGSDSGKPLSEDSDLMMFVPDGVLDSISKFGFQNQHTTRTSNGYNSRETRYRQEIEFPGMILGYGPKSKEVLPKYAALDVQRKENIGDYASTPYHYGNIVFVFKESVKKRASWTPMDSLGYGGLRGSSITSTLNFKEKKDQNFKCTGYCETQIWGPLDFTDVDYVIITPGTTVPETLKKANIPVYFSQESESSVKIKKGELAFKGDPNRKDQSSDLSQVKSDDTILKRILDQKKIPSMTIEKLIEEYNKASDIEDKRLFLSQLTLKRTPETKKILMKELIKTADSISRSQILIGLSPYGKDDKVRSLLKDFLALKKSEYKNESFSYDTNSLDVLTLMAIVSDTSGFKEDKELVNGIQELQKESGKLKTWYERLFKKAPLCPPNIKDPTY